MNAQELLEKYPKIFAQRTLPMTQTCMCWGIECGGGWMEILSDLCEKIQKHVDESGIPQVEATQVKEKFGGLRFYVNGGDEYIENLIDEAEEKSYQTCESCGATEKVSTGGCGLGWVSTLCNECRR